MSLGFGLEKINDIFSGDGIAPVFSASEMAILKHRAEIAKVKYIPNQVMGIAPYDLKVFNFVLSYKRNETPWAIMNRNQRDWLLKIKDSLK